MTCKISNLPIIVSPVKITKQPPDILIELEGDSKLESLPSSKQSDLSVYNAKELTLTWDGSFLGEYSSSILGPKIATNKGLTLRTIETECFRTTGCLKCPRNTSIPCILDELKTCFGLPKIGTHRIRIGGRMYIMYHNQLSDWRLDKLSKSQLEKIDKRKMQRLIAFRFLLSIPNPQNSSFVLHPSSGEIYSFNEPKTHLGEHTVDPTEGFINYWFEETDFRENILSILPKSAEESIANFLYSFRQQIEKVLERVDSDYVWLASYLVEKITKLAAEIGK